MTEILTIDTLAAVTMRVPIVGTAPLIVSQFSEKAKRMILDKQQGRKVPRENRDPEGEYERSLYRMKDGFGFPAVAFKAATVSASRLFGAKMTHTRQALFVHGEYGPDDAQALIRIDGTPRMREDTVRLAGPGRTADLRYRGEFPEWSAVLPVTFVNSFINQSSVLSLLDAAGLTVGIGEWRPEHNGDFGTFKIDPSRDVEVIS